MDARKQGGRRGPTVVLFAATLILLSPSPAQAAVPETIPDVPLPVQVVGSPPDAASGGSTPPTTTQPAPTTVPPAPSPAPPPTAEPEPTASTGSERGRRTKPPVGVPLTTVRSVVPVAAGSDADDVSLPDHGAAVPTTARRFGFPLALAALVSAFVAVQGRLDRRDPKLAAAPISIHDDLLPFA